MAKANQGAYSDKSRLKHQITAKTHAQALTPQGQPKEVAGIGASTDKIIRTMSKHARKAGC